MTLTPAEFSRRYDIPPQAIRGALRRMPGGSPKSDELLSEAQLTHLLRSFEAETSRPLAERSTPELLADYADILAELRARGVARTGNAPIGDYAEHLALRVYGGSLVGNSVKSYDLVSADGRHIQVKARALSRIVRPAETFSAFRSFDFDMVTLLLFDARTYALRWARELTPDEVLAASRKSKHINAHLVSVRAVEQLGVDATERFAEAMAD